jgi:hypothetical protein
VFFAALHGFQFLLSGYAPVVELYESGPQFVEGYEVVRGHLLVAPPPAINLRQLIDPQLGFLIGVTAHVAALQLDHGVEVRAQSLRVFEDAEYSAPHRGLQLLGPVVLAVRTRFLAVLEELIEARGAVLVFLPAYSPDFSPIEEAFSKIKALLKKAAARTREALVEAISRALRAVTVQDAKGWFAHCGYAVRDQAS